MLRPERMSKVSVTGSRGVMSPVIETIHGLNLVHLSDYDGSWEGFDNGDPIEGAESASEKLVTVRALESTLDLSVDDVDPDPGALEDGWEDRLESIRTRINELDDRRNEINDELRQVNERIDRVAPFAALGIDLDLLSGYDSVDVLVGEGSFDEVEAALETADEIRTYETFTDDGVVAIVAAPSESAGDNPIDDALVGVEFTRHDVPETDQSPEAYVSDLESQKVELESQLEEIDAELEEIKQSDGEFLLRAEEELTIEVQQAEAPLQFATTDHAFVAEGWLPTEEYDRLVSGLNDVVGDSVEIEELVRADYNDEGYPTRTEAVEHDGTEDSSESVAKEEEERETREALADGGSATASGAVTMVDEPPVIQNNVGPAKPFEFLLRLIDRPKYSELDPTIVLLLTFPAFYGFMLGDLGYGLLYTGVGYLLYSRFDQDIVRGLGAIGMWAGGFTMLFGILYGEIFGLHVLGETLFSNGPPLRKGIQPAFSEFSQAWLLASVFIGLAHLTVGYIFGFINDLEHGVGEAFFENGSWALLMIGLWMWIFSRQGEGAKPAFLFETFSSEGPIPIGFNGFPVMEVFSLPEAAPAVLGGLAIGVPMLIALFGFVTMVYGEVRHYGALGIIIGGLESFNVFGDVLSYLRMAAVILAKAGMAFVVNMLFFGVYVVETDSGAEWHFGTSHAPQYMLEQGTYHGYEVSEVMFGGLLHGGILMAIIGVFVLVLGHVVVLLLGITSAGLQGIRLEYVEFFNRFYEGGGRKFEPFGRERIDDDN